MTTIFSDTGMQMQLLRQQGGKSHSGTQEKNRGVPTEIIAQGPSVVKAWGEESEKVHGPVKVAGNADENKMNNSANDSLMQQLEKSGISYESYVKASEAGPKAMEELLKDHDFSLDMKG